MSKRENPCYFNSEENTCVSFQILFDIRESSKSNRNLQEVELCWCCYSWSYLFSIWFWKHYTTTNSVLLLCLFCHHFFNVIFLPQNIMNGLLKACCLICKMFAAVETSLDFYSFHYGSLTLNSTAWRM